MRLNSGSKLLCSSIALDAYDCLCFDTELHPLSELGFSKSTAVGNWRYGMVIEDKYSDGLQKNVCYIILGGES